MFVAILKQKPATWTMIHLLGDDGRLLPTQELFQLTDFQRNLDQSLETLLDVPRQLFRTLVCSNVALEVHPDSSSLTSGTTQPPHNTTSIIKSDNLTLVLADAAVDGVCVVKVVRFRNGESRFGRCRGMLCSNERLGADRFLQSVDQLLGSGRLDFLVIVAREEGSSVDGVMPLQEIVDSDEFVGRFLVRGGEDVQPS